MLVRMRRNTGSQGHWLFPEHVPFYPSLWTFTLTVPTTWNTFWLPSLPGKCLLSFQRQTFLISLSLHKAPEARSSTFSSHCVTLWLPVQALESGPGLNLQLLLTRCATLPKLLNLSVLQNPFHEMRTITMSTWMNVNCGHHHPLGAASTRLGTQRSSDRLLNWIVQIRDWLQSTGKVGHRNNNAIGTAPREIWGPGRKLWLEVQPNTPWLPLPGPEVFLSTNPHLLLWTQRPSDLKGNSCLRSVLQGAMSSGGLKNVKNQLSGEREKASWLVVFANFPGINTPDHGWLQATDIPSLNAQFRDAQQCSILCYFH